MKYLLTFGTSLILSLIATPASIRLANRFGIIDQPVDSRWHKKPTPRMGGVAIFLSFIAASAIFGDFRRETLLLLLGGVGIFSLGLLDDKFGTFPKFKFLFQLIIALALVLFGIRLMIIPAFVAIPLTIVWIVMITNAFNLLDNMDGLSAGVAAIASFVFFLLSWKSGQKAVPILALALTGASLGFLRYNFNPAKVFMGDCGSLFLGYILSTLAIEGFWQSASPLLPALTAPVLILAVAVFDTILVTVLRISAGGRPWIGGKDHSSHRLVKLGLSERQAVLLLYTLSIVGSGSAFFVLNTGLTIGIPLVAFLCLVAVGFGFFLSRAET